MKNEIENPQLILGYNPETGDLWWLETGRPAGHVNDRGYRVIEINRKRHKAHRIAWCIFHGKYPDGEIDHINRNKSDNRIVNLRDVSTQGNMRNRGLQKNNTSGYAGVCWHNNKKKWISKIKVNGEWKWLGEFDDKNQAIATRQVAEDLYDFL